MPEAITYKYVKNTDIIKKYLSGIMMPDTYYNTKLVLLAKNI